MSFHWQEAKWPLSKGDEISHLHHEDIRRWLFLLLRPDACKDKIDGYMGVEEQWKWENVMHAFEEEDPRGAGHSDEYYWRPGNTRRMGNGLHAEPVVWYEEEYSGSIIEVNPDENYVIVSGDKISPAAGGHFRTDDPLLISGNADNNGFYRASGASLDGSNTKVYLTTSPAKLRTTASGGTIACDFGGDWYCSYGFWSWLDTCHNETKTKKRPPAGGIYSVDSAGYTSLGYKGYGTCWRRTVNPYIYHHYDKNSHRRIVRTYYDSESDDLYIYDNPASDWLPIQVDPKEQDEPVLYRDTKRTRWLFKGKVAIERLQLTDIPSMGPIRALYDAEHPKTNQYVMHQTGVEYPDSDEAFPDRVNEKLTCGALQSMIEFYASKSEWMLAVDADYKSNWFNKHAHEIDYLDPSKTYGQTHTYNSAKNPHQPSYAYLRDDNFGCNGSAFEKILKDLGSYDWYFDTATPYTPGWVLAARWEMAEAECTPLEIDRQYPLPTGTWRRTWKYSLGKIHPTRMRAYEAGTPTGEDWPSRKFVNTDLDLTYDATFSSPWIGIKDGYWTYNHSTEQHVWHDVTDVDYTPGDSDFSNFNYVVDVTETGYIFTVDYDKTSKFIPGSTIWFEGESTGMSVIDSKYTGGKTYVQVGTELTTGDDGKTVYGDTRLAARHDPVQVAAGVPQFEAYHDILQDCYEIVSVLKLKYAPVSILERDTRDGGDAPEWYSTEQAVALAGIAAMPEAGDPDTWEGEYACIGKVMNIERAPNDDGGYKYHQRGMGNLNAQVRYLAAMRIVAIDEAVDKVYVRMGFQNSVDNPPIDRHYTVTFRIPGGGTVSIPPDGIKYYYWAALNSSAYEDWFILGEDIPYRLTVPCTINGAIWQASVIVTYGLNLTDSCVYEFDWDGFDDEIWDRDITRATRIEQDPEDDDDPPVPDPPSFATEPVLTDVNYDDAVMNGIEDPYATEPFLAVVVESHHVSADPYQITLTDKPYGSFGAMQITYPYPPYELTEIESGVPGDEEYIVNYDTGVITFNSAQEGWYVTCTFDFEWYVYVAEWHILMTSILCEDLEGNGVEYKFTGSGGAASYTSDWQESRTYDFKIGDGTMAALQAAIDAGLKTGWKFTVRAKDNASASGVGQTDNIGTASARTAIDTAAIPP